MCVFQCQGAKIGSFWIQARIWSLKFLGLFFYFHNIMVFKTLYAKSLKPWTVGKMGMLDAVDAGCWMLEKGSPKTDAFR
jgi:hypothetical protein